MPQVSEIDRALSEVRQQDAPLTFHFQDLVPDPALDVIELEQTSRHRTSSGKAGALRPSEPIAYQRPQARESFDGLHRGLDDMSHRELGHMRKQLDLDVLFRAEVREQSAFRHSDLISQNAERYATQA